MTSTKESLPQRVHDYSRHHLLDPERWDSFAARSDDVIVASSQKAGTTLTQAIIANLIFQDGNIPGPIGEICPWLDMRLRPLHVTTRVLENQCHRRSLKTHLPLNGLRYLAQVKYVVVGRDTRDVFMSLLNHHRSYSDKALAAAAQFNEMMGAAFPPDVGSDHDFWRSWMSSSWFGWEGDGYPYWSHLNHAQSWWDFRDLPNIFFVHFADLLADPATEVRRIAEFLAIELDEERLPGILRRVSFGEMKKNFDNILPEMNTLMQRGAESFMFKGTNGRWREFLSAEDLELYDKAASRALSPDCRAWLEGGRHA